MKILFVQLRFESNMAVMCLSSFLEREGYKTEVMIIEGERDYVTKVKEEIRPNVIAYSATTVDIKKLLTTNTTLKENFDFFSIFGGAHPTFFPELIEKEPYIDAICIGEGEYAMGELLEKLKNGQGLDHIENLYVKKDGRIIRNRLRPLIKDLDSLPFLNKHIYSNYYCNPYLLENVPIRFLASRGCPYKCTYCFNHKFFELYGVQGKLVRKRSVDSIIQEIKEVKKDFDIPMVSFVDDIFCIPKAWIREFAEKYSSEIALPYSINTRPNTVTDEIAALLKMSGCYYVTFSVETGDEFLRNIILKRNINDEDIISAANLLHKYNIHFCTGNMLGIPGETLETLKKTVEINQRCAPHYAWASLFQPFPGMELTSYAIEKGYFDGNFETIGDDQFTDSPLELERKRTIVRFHKFFALLVKYPYTGLLIRFFLRFPLDGLYNWLFMKYKMRLNLPVIRASRQMLELQYREPLISVIAFYIKDLVVDLVSLFGKLRSNMRKA